MATIKVDFANKIAAIKPMHGVGQPQFSGADFSMIHYLKEAWYTIFPFTLTLAVHMAVMFMLTSRIFLGISVPIQMIPRLTILLLQIY